MNFYVLTGLVFLLRLLQMNTEMLKQKAEMLEEYFGIYVDSQGKLSRLPVILDQYTPDMDRVPEFVLCLGNDVSSDSYFLSSFLCMFFYLIVYIVALADVMLSGNLIDYVCESCVILTSKGSTLLWEIQGTCNFTIVFPIKPCLERPPNGRYNSFLFEFIFQHNSIGPKTMKS